MAHLNRALILVAVVGLSAATCGKSPSGPSSGTSELTYTGTLSLADGSKGMLILKTTQASVAQASMTRGALAAVQAWFEPRLLAQASATGTLILDNGTVVALSGTYSAGRFNVTGSGYAVTATVSGGAVTGTATTPSGGAATVVPVEAPAVSAPAPSNAAGTYSTAYTMNAVGYFYNTLVSNGARIGNCTYNIVITGTLTLQLGPSGTNNYDGHLINSWTETEGPRRDCAFSIITSPITPAGPAQVDNEGPATNIVFARVESGTPSGGVRTIAETFVGAVSGTTVVGRFTRISNFTVSVNGGTQTHY